MSRPSPGFRSEPGRRLVTDAYRRVLAAAPVPLHSRFVTFGAVRCHLLETGPVEGKALLLLHGSASNSATWLGDIPAWSREYRVIAADLPGHPGLSEGPPLALSSGAAAGWLEGLLDAIGLDRVLLAGMSLGGWTAIEFACRHPERVRALSLLSPAGLAAARRSFVLKALPLTLLGDRGSDRIQRLVFGKAEIPRPILEFTRLVSRHYRPLLERPRVFTDAELGRLRMPVQGLFGSDDVLLRAGDSARRLARVVPHAEVRLLGGTGHAVLGQTQPILAFLRRAGSADPAS